MAGLWWTTVTLVFLLSVGSLAAVDQNKLAKLIQDIKDKYPIHNKMFSLAVSIKSEDPDNLNQILEKSPNESVQEAISKKQVYKGERLTVATVPRKKHEHAEWRVLNNLELVGDDLLVIFSHASSCNNRCTNTSDKSNIIEPIENLINSKKWKKYAFVFETVFKPRGSQGIDEEKLKQALKDLAKSGIGLANIFRCYTPKEFEGNKEKFQCTSCSSDGEVNDKCVSYNA